MVSSFTPVLPSRILLAMLSSPSGSSREVRPEEAKALELIFCNPAGRRISVSAEQYLKAALPMEVTVAGRITSVSTFADWAA